MITVTTSTNRETSTSRPISRIFSVRRGEGRNDSALIEHDDRRRFEDATQIINGAPVSTDPLPSTDETRGASTEVCPSPSDAALRSNNSGESESTVYMGYIVDRTDPFRRLVMLIVCVAIVWTVALVCVMLFRPKRRTVFLTNSPMTSRRSSSVRPSVVSDVPLSPWSVPSSRDSESSSHRPSVSSSPSDSLSPSTRPTVTTSPTKARTWTRIGDNDVTGKKPGAQLGHVVALSGDGNRLFALSNIVSYVGVFDLVSTKTWSTWEESFDFSSLLNNAAPLTLATTPDGRVLVVGNPNSFSKFGATYVFKEDDETGTWARKGQTMVGIKQDCGFGFSVDVTDDGDRIAVGNPEGGYVTVFAFSVVDDEVNENGDQREEWIVRATLNGKLGSNFGSVLALSGDGSRIVVRSLLYINDGIGTVSFYDLPDDNIIVQGGDPTQKISENGSFASALATSADGTVVAMGDQSRNYVRVFRLDVARKEYVQIGDDLTPDDQPFSWFGHDVALSRDGSRLAVGFPSDTDEDMDKKGKVYVYSVVGDDSESDENSGGNYTVVGELHGEQLNGFFGWAVSLSDDGDRLAISAAFADIGGQNTGSVVVYELS